jgi:hypothetical protein
MAQAIEDLEEAKKVSPNPLGVQARIDELKAGKR